MKLIKFLILFIVISFQSLSASSYFSFKKYQVEEGLSHNTVWCGMQDSYGFIWLGTSDGLNRFDGRSNTVYRNVLNNKSSLENNFVQALLEEGQNIWVGTNSGLYIYNRTKDAFSFFDKTTQYGVSISSEIKKIIQTQNGLLWIGTLGQGLFVYDPKTEILSQNSVHTSFVWDICQSEDKKKVYVSSLQEGLLCFNENGRFLQSYKISHDLKSPESYKINCILDVNGKVWVGSGNNMLSCVDSKTGTVENVGAALLNFGAARCLLKYSTQELLVGTDDGLYLFDLESKMFRRADDPSDTRSLSDQTINAMMWDAEGALWVFTNLGGVNYMSKQTKRFDFYSPAQLTGAVGAGKVIGPFCENKEGNLWIGTQKGLYFFNTSTNELTPYTIKGIDSRQLDIRSLLLDGDNLWIGTYAEGIRVVNVRTGAVKAYIHSRQTPNSIGSNEVLCIYKDKMGDIFVGTSWGFSRYNPETDNFMVTTSIGSMISIVDICEDKYNNLWIATTNSGVFSFNTLSGHWKHYQHDRETPTTITSNSIMCLFEDAGGTMWFGTNGGGLCSFDPKKEAFVEFDSRFPTKVIYSIEQDQTGSFWISTNAGLFKVNPYSKDHFRQFTVNDGLQGSQFMARSSIKTSGGKMYFGGINGFNVFQPDRFVNNPYIPPVYVTDIRFPNQVDKQKTKELIHQEEPLYMADKIKLSYENNSFTIRFAALSYEDPAKNRYSYILNGVDKEWVVNSENNVASYTNLSPGTYKFEVKGSNNDYQWNDKATTLLIVITPPWWLSNIAYFVYFLLLAGCVVLLAWRWNLRVKQKYSRRMEKYQVAKEQEVYKSKIGFFINLVHEIRTPLSLIKLPLEKLQETEQDTKTNKYLSVIDKNVNYLLGITNQLLDFQKMENGALQLNLVNSNINELVSDVYNQFTAPAELKGIELILSLPDQELYSIVDREKISKIIVNLMGNAIKYANKHIELKLVANDDDDDYAIYVSDDGPGVPDSQKTKIFDAFYQLPNDKIANATGTGIGLAFARSLAEAHHGSLQLENNISGGSSFILLLPLNESATEETPDLVEIHEDEQQDSSEETNSEFSGKRFTILLVEDNVELLNLTKDSLSAWYRVLKASNGVEALEVLKRDSPDVIVSDVMMPEMDGLELCTKLKSDLDFSHIPVILLTAKTTLESKVEGLECGADVYLEKPFSIKQLHMQIDNLLKLRLNFHKMMTSLSDAIVQSSSGEYAMSQRDFEFIAKIQAVIAEQLADESFSIDSLAEQVHMSRSNFYRKIKALTGISPNDYLKTLRMNRAAELIQSGIRISEVAAQVGFTSSSYFAKCFKAQYGVLPKDYTGQPPLTDE